MAGLSRSTGADVLDSAQQGHWPVVKLVAIAKNEAPYIPLWVFHHFRIGIDLIEIHINNTDDNSIRICKRIKQSHDNFNFIKSDPLFIESSKVGRPFQIDAYNQSLKKSKDGDDPATHLLVLDLDEFLTPNNLEGNIKQIIQESPSTDVFSFLWYSDDYKKMKSPFGLPFQKETSIYRMDHVKSMANISSDLISCNHHNFIYRETYNPANQFAERTDIRLNDDNNTSIRRSKLNQEFLNTLDQENPEAWFVLHCIYRSEIEYLSSLSRGRSHNNDLRPIKSNRWGLKPYPAYSSEEIIMNIAPAQLKSYRRDYNLFKRNSKLLGKIKRARGHTRSRAEALDKFISSNPSILNTYKRCFAGTKHDPKLRLPLHPN
jgi:hypothetical protein|tara:strand:+ start:407 stop:1528 length:1122 start_codon:yes stop_codon:yes gene_type:complete